MEAAAATPVAAPVAGAGAAMPTPPPAASPQYTPPPTPQTSMPMMADGGSVEDGSGAANKIKEFFSDINVLDVAISAFIVGGVLYAIHYYKFMIMMEKTGYSDLSTRIQRLESQLAAAKKAAEMNAAGNAKSPMMRNKRALVSL